MLFEQEESEDPRKKKLEKEEKRRKRWNMLPSWIKKNSFLTTFLIDKIKWCERGQFPIGLTERMEACESALKLLDEATKYLKGLEQISNLTDKQIEELHGRVTTLQNIMNKEVQCGVYDHIIEIEEKTESLSLLLQRAKAEEIKLTKER